MSSTKIFQELENGLIFKREMDRRRQQILEFWSKVKVTNLTAAKYLKEASDEASEEVGALMEGQGIEIDSSLVDGREVGGKCIQLGGGTCGCTC